MLKMLPFVFLPHDSLSWIRELMRNFSCSLPFQLSLLCSCALNTYLDNTGWHLREREWCLGEHMPFKPLLLASSITHVSVLASGPRLGIPCRMVNGKTLLTVCRNSHDLTLMCSLGSWSVCFHGGALGVQRKFHVPSSECLYTTIALCLLLGWGGEMLWFLLRNRSFWFFSFNILRASPGIQGAWSHMLLMVIFKNYYSGLDLMAQTARPLMI